jgi:long-chain fatty acid transport protein
MKRFYVRPLLVALCTTGVTALSVQAIASGFQLWEQDGASIGNYHAGYAAEAADASTAFYNPAGITRFKNQQIVFAGVGVATNIKYQGDVSISTINTGALIPDTSQGGVFAFVPALHYVTPITENTGFGFSVAVPFGMKVYYGKSTPLRYISTMASVTVIDISPTYAFKITDKVSFGLGPDIQPMKGSFNQIGTLGGELDSDGINSADDTAYGYHFGGLYEFSSDTRAGISYHSKVVHHLTGTSTFTGPLATNTDLEGPSNPAGRNTVNITLPPYTALSVYYRLHPQFAIMASAIFTQWNTIKNLVLQDVAGVSSTSDRTASLKVTIPQYFRNTWNFSIGANYYATDKIMLRSGVGYDQTPVSDTYRNVQMPDNDRYVVAFGGHYQATKAVGFDLGWMHLFMNKAHISPPPQVTGIETAITSGSVKGGADVYSAQVTWDIV